MAEKKLRKIKTIQINADNCSGCRLCEAVCSAYHSEPKYTASNPRRSRIQIFRDEQNDIYLPILAGNYFNVECNSRTSITINGKRYGSCSFCRASCPSRDLFKEPDNPGIPLKCDVCGEPMPEGGPMCVKACLVDALTYVETEEVFDLNEEEDIVEEL